MGLDRGRRSRARSLGLAFVVDGRRRPHDPETGDAVSGAAGIAGLEVEEALEDRGGAGPVRFALTAVHDDDARRAGTQLVRRPGDRGPTPLRPLPPGEASCGPRRLRLRRRARRLGALSACTAAAAATRSPAPGIVLHPSSLARRAVYHCPKGAR